MNTKTNILQNAGRVILVLVFSLSLFGIPSGRASAGSPFVVNSDGDGGDLSLGDGTCETAVTGECTLRAALQEANALVGTDTINFSADMAITPVSQLPDIHSEMTIDGSGKNVTINGSHLYQVMKIYSIVTLNHLSIVNGEAFDGAGGGVYAGSATLTVMNSTFSGNSARHGGAICTVGGTLAVTDSTFSGNDGTYGGGIYAELGATLTVTNSNFSGNEGTYGGGIDIQNSSLTVMNSTFSSNSAVNYGGAIYSNNGTLTVTGSTLSGNSGTYGGGIYNSTGTTNINNSTFSSNSATTYNGGGIFSFNSPLTVSNSTFSGNTAVGDGGAIYIFRNIDPSTLTLTNSTFSGNSALRGGALFSSAGTMTVTNSTFSGNIATTGHGGGIYDDVGTLNLSNTILANSTATEDCYTNGDLIPGTNNLIEINHGCGSPVSSADPNLGPLAGNGGLTQTFALLAGSPAINAGDDATCAAEPVSNKDQRGVTRPFGAHCDIGSYEQNKGSLTTQSVGANDGWILESGEKTNIGGTRDSTSPTFNLGDETGDRQYRAILSFNTGALPDTAVITKVTLKIKRPATGYLVGNNLPFMWGLGLKVDGCRNFFGSSGVLQLGDFNFNNPANCTLLVGAFGGTPVASWFSANILGTAFARISKTGTTQFRLRFAKDDNDDNAADYLKFYSGNYAYAASRPTLIIEYYVP